MLHHEKIPYERLIQIANDCIRYIGYDNDNMTETLQALRLSAEELLEIGCPGYAELVHEEKDEEEES